MLQILYFYDIRKMRTENLPSLTQIHTYKLAWKWFAEIKTKHSMCVCVCASVCTALVREIIPKKIAFHYPVCNNAKRAYG